MIIKQSSHRDAIERYARSSVHCGTKIRPVRLSDAEFIVALRTHGALNKHISPTSGNVLDQKRWIEGYLERFNRGEEAYFIAEYAGVDCGTIRIYNYDIIGGAFVYGSWLMSPEAPACCAFSTTILNHNLGFETLGFLKVCYDVRKENKSVCGFHDALGATLVREDGINRYYEITSQAYPAVRVKLDKFARRFHERPFP